MKPIILLLASALWGIATTAMAQAGSGTVCVASRADDPFWKGGAIPGLRVRIDKRPAAPWPEQKSLKIDQLDRSERHLLVVLDKNKPIESMFFKFSEFKRQDLCMSYDGYQGIQLSEATKRTPWCKCE